MSNKINAGDLGEMRSWEEDGEIYLSVNDLIHYLEGNKHRMTEVLPEHVTADRFIKLLRSFEQGIKSL